MAGLTDDAHGTFTPADASEHDVFTPDSVNLLKYYMFKIFTGNMVSGDKIEIRIYDWDDVAGAFVMGDLITLVGPTSTGSRFYQAPIPQYRMKVTYKEIANSGTHKAFNWIRLSN